MHLCELISRNGIAKSGCLHTLPSGVWKGLCPFTFLSAVSQSSRMPSTCWCELCHSPHCFFSLYLWLCSADLVSVVSHPWGSPVLIIMITLITINSLAFKRVRQNDMDFTSVHRSWKHNPEIGTIIPILLRKRKNLKHTRLSNLPGAQSY